MTVARVLHSFGHDVLAAGLAGGASGELIIQDLARSGVPTAFTLIRGESRRFFRFSDPEPDGPALRFSEPGPYITTEELGRFAADYRRLLAGAAAVVLCGSLPDGLPADTYGSLVTYAAEAGVPVILDAGGEELKHAVGHGPDLVVAESNAAETGTGGFGAALIRLGAAAAAVAVGGQVHAVTGDGEWTARLEPADAAGSDPASPWPAARWWRAWCPASCSAGPGRTGSGTPWPWPRAGPAPGPGRRARRRSGMAWTWPPTSGCSTRSGSSRRRSDTGRTQRFAESYSAITQSVLGSGFGSPKAANLGLVDFQTPSWNGAIVNKWRIDCGDRCLVRLTPSAITA